DLVFYDERYISKDGSDWSGTTFQFLYENYSLFGNTALFKPLPLAHAADMVLPSRLTVLEAGPVRVRVRTAVKALFPTKEPKGMPHTEEITYLRDYSLVVGEPLVRMAATGQAPSNFSVLITFPLNVAGNITAFTHGTPYHWSRTPLVPAWLVQP